MNSETFAHDLEDLKARFRRVVGQEIRQMASDASDALDLDTPRPDFSKRYLEQLITTIDKYVSELGTRA